MSKKTVKILTVDDSPLIRKSISMALTAGLKDEYDVQILEAVDGLDALEVLNANNDVVLAYFDWHMPKMEGAELVEKVRADERFKRMRIVMATAEKEKNAVTEIAKKGINAYLPKPFEQAKVVSIAKQMLGRMD